MVATEEALEHLPSQALRCKRAPAELCRCAQAAPRRVGLSCMLPAAAGTAGANSVVMLSTPVHHVAQFYVFKEAASVILPALFAFPPLSVLVSLVVWTVLTVHCLVRGTFCAGGARQPGSCQARLVLA